MLGSRGHVRKMTENAAIKHVFGVGEEVRAAAPVVLGIQEALGSWIAGGKTQGNHNTYERVYQRIDYVMSYPDWNPHLPDFTGEKRVAIIYLRVQSVAYTAVKRIFGALGRKHACRSHQDHSGNQNWQTTFHFSLPFKGIPAAVRLCKDS
jgi:hypothetical protein